jgi:hypothetical protein
VGLQHLDDGFSAGDRTCLSLDWFVHTVFIPRDRSEEYSRSWSHVNLKWRVE